MQALIVDDDDDHRLSLAVLLNAWGYEVQAVENGARALAVLAGEDAPRLVILDWRMPVMTGLQVCREVRRWEKRPYTYVLLLTGLNDKRDIIEGLEAGADDFLTKPYDVDELRARLGAGQRVLELQDQLIAAHEALREQAMRDALTGLWNRGAILDILGRELERARRRDEPMGVLMADLDHFKEINDTYGHLVGDVVLRETAQRMRSAGRPYDSVGRYGGEEFLAVLPCCPSAIAVQIAERIRQRVAARPLELKEGCVVMTMSLGVATFMPDEPADAICLLHAADAALYKAKHGGRNRAVLAGACSEMETKPVPYRR